MRTGAAPCLFLGYLDDCEDGGRAWSLSGIVGGLRGQGQSLVSIWDIWMIVRTGAEPGLFMGYLGDCEGRGRAWYLSGIVGGL